MTYYLPTMSDVHQKICNLTALYKVEYQNKVSFFRSNVENPDRLSDASFIQSIALSIQSRKHRYDKLDKDFQDERFDKVTSLFLRKVVAGALLFVLTKIVESYYWRDPKSNSALAATIFNLFGVDKLQEIPLEDRMACFRALKKYCLVIENAKETLEPIRWHENLTNSELNEKIDAVIKALSEVVSSDEEESSWSSMDKQSRLSV